jgi:hypothetical protein
LKTSAYSLEVWVLPKGPQGLVYVLHDKGVLDGNDLLRRSLEIRSSIWVLLGALVRE